MSEENLWNILGSGLCPHFICRLGLVFIVLDSPLARVGTFYFSTHMHLQDSRGAETILRTPKNRGTEGEEWVFVGIALMSLLQPLADSALSLLRCLLFL